VLFQRLNQFCLLFVVSIAFVGCGGSDAPPVVPVKGVVTFKKAPIGKINVMFVPADGKGLFAEGTTDASGKFELQTREPGDGAVVGSYSVSFKFVSDVIPDMPGFAGGTKPEPSPIPLKYADETKSGITATVDANASKNDFKFDLN
jgi:hypothetical protein